ncbi:2-amino-4-hydroxy-6-hydroxymethyldihydropteridine diphosphokinase [Thermovibrio sp.]
MKAVLLLGSNLGNRNENIKRAVELIKRYVGKVLKESSTLETAPFGVESQPYFLNKGVLVETSHPPFELLNLLKWIEKRIGRYKTYRWGPRVIDVDVITYGSLKVDTEKLKLPHPGLREREFFRKIYKELLNESFLLNRL